MELHTAEALLLDTFDLDDKDRLVTFLTREFGKKKGVARGARRKYSPFSGQLQPLAKLTVTWFEKGGRELVRIRNAEMIRPAGKIQEELEGILLGAYLAEHLTELVQENESGELYFRLLDSTLDALRGGADRDLAARYFESWALRLAGIFPAPTECPGCGRSLASGALLAGDGEALLCRDCGGSGLAVGPEAIALLLRIGRERLVDLAATPPGEALLRQVEDVCGRVRRAFLQKELRSYDVMRRTLAEIRGPGR